MVCRGLGWFGASMAGQRNKNVFKHNINPAILVPFPNSCFVFIFTIQSYPALQMATCWICIS